MIQLAPDMGRLARWAERRRLLAPHGAEDDLGYALHALLVANFGDFAPKPFALLRPPGRAAQLLAYSRHPGGDLRRAGSAFAEPEAAEAVGLHSLAAKAMPQDWPVGTRLGFEVRVRPMVRTDRDGNRDRSREVDAFVVSPPGSDRGTIYGEWLRARLDAGGADLVTARLDSFRLGPVMRRTAAEADGRRPMRKQVGPEATFTGALTIRDPDAFGALLARGVGRHRAFGFGMLLLRPAR
jgi:CRISPR system Cascade subunit CasE